VTLREAILAANLDVSVDGSPLGRKADTILFATGQGVIFLGSQLPLVTEGLSISGPGSGVLVVDGNQSSRILEIDRGVSVKISGLTIARGNSGGSDGAGILNRGTLTVTRSRFLDNATARDGGAIANHGVLFVDRSFFSGNSALNGGAVLNNHRATVTASTFSSNFTGGIAPFVGGGCAMLNMGTLRLIHSTLSDNFAGNGGAIVNGRGAWLLMLNSTVSGNEVLNTGGGIAGESGISIIGATVTGNRANSDGDGIGDGGGIAITGKAALGNSIVAGNFTGTALADSDVLGTLSPASSFNLIGVDTGLNGVADGTNGNHVGTAAAPLDPGLDLLMDNGGPTETHALAAGSGAIDAGAPDCKPPLDQRGARRPQGTACDIGAYETVHLFEALLSGAEEVPPIATIARGEARLTVAPGEMLFLFELKTVNIPDVTDVTLHCAPEGINGSPGIELYSGGPLTNPRIAEVVQSPIAANACGWIDVADVVDAMRAGTAYVNVVTAAHPTGEIRGQVQTLLLPVGGRRIGPSEPFLPRKRSP
jgi:hypothetical protein